MTAAGAEIIAQRKLRFVMTRLAEDHSIEVDGTSDRIRIHYAAPAASAGNTDATQLSLWFHPRDGVMWIDYLSVATGFRCSGHGRRLVAAAEQIALRLGSRVIQVFPLTAAREFWQKVGFAAHPCTARVMVKEVANVDSRCLANSNESSEH